MKPTNEQITKGLDSFTRINLLIQEEINFMEEHVVNFNSLTIQGKLVRLKGKVDTCRDECLKILVRSAGE